MEIFSGERVGDAGAPPAPPSSARCGPRPASRTRPTLTRMYVDQLIAPYTVNTMPLATLNAVADHGTVPAPPRGSTRPPS